jgi:hypothetical protein
MPSLEIMHQTSDLYGECRMRCGNNMLASSLIKDECVYWRFKPNVCGRVNVMLGGGGRAMLGCDNKNSTERYRYEYLQCKILNKTGYSSIGIVNSNRFVRLDSQTRLGTASLDPASISWNNFSGHVLCNKCEITMDNCNSESNIPKQMNTFPILYRPTRPNRNVFIWKNGDIIGCLVDLKDEKIHFSNNGVWMDECFDLKLFFRMCYREKGKEEEEEEDVAVNGGCAVDKIAKSMQSRIETRIPNSWQFATTMYSGTSMICKLHQLQDFPQLNDDRFAKDAVLTSFQPQACKEE